MKKIIIPIVLLIIAAMLFVSMTKVEQDKGFIFHTPAYQGKKDMKDVPEGVATSFYDAWDKYVNRYTVIAADYNLSGGYDNTVPGKTYVNPKNHPDFFKDAAQIPVRWESFPGRVLHYLEQRFDSLYGSTKGQSRMFEMVDIGPEAYQAKYEDNIVFIPKNPCNPNPKELKMLDPKGPRGWLDEYCEMSMLKNSADKLVKLHFTCENPEYFWTMWKIDPTRVYEIYKETLGNDNIELKDLYLKDSLNNYVIDRTTGLPAYNPINKWNNGTKMTATYGGAMHLTSPPNELSAEMVLAGGGAVLRNGNADTLAVANTLICCSKYGAEFRHSDPHIGQNVYQAVKEGLEVTLLDPVGLYLQEPQYNYFELPDNAPTGAKIEDCFTFVRGAVSTPGYPNNMILHMIMQVPSHWDSSITLNDFTVLGEKIEYGSQVMETIKVQLAAAGKPATSKTEELDCTVANKIVGVDYFTEGNILEASVYRRLNVSANVTSNITSVAQNSTASNLAVVISNVMDDNGNAIKPEDFNPSDIEISFPDVNINVIATYVGKLNNRYASLTADKSYTFYVNIEVPADTPVGQYSILVTNKGKGLAVPHMIEIVAEGALAH